MIKENSDISTYVKKYFGEKNFEKISFKELKNGVNSNVYKVSKDKKQLILKIYPNKDFLRRDRIGNEYNFLNLLNKNGYTNIPQPIKWNFKKKWMLMTFLEGEFVKDIKNEHYEKLINFIIEIQNLKKKTLVRTINNASEACFSLADHYKSINYRTNVLNTKIESQNSLNKNNRETLALLVKKINSITELIYKNQLSDLSGSEFKNNIKTNQKILSQSDIGFHNIFENINHDLLFFDFEYSGWDDPGKLLSDLILHPDYNLPLTSYNLLDKYMYNCLLKNKYQLKRLKILLDIYRLKWVVIILNPIFQYSNDESINEIAELKLEKAKIFLDNSLLTIEHAKELLRI